MDEIVTKAYELATKAQEFATMVSGIVVQLSDGMGRTVFIFCLTLLFSLPLGLLICFGRMSKITPLRWLMNFYISVMRGTPLMLQLIVVYFGPYYLFKIRLALEYRFYAVIIAFSINYAAYFAEIFRGGIQAMPLGQYEAAQVMGYGRTQTFLKIIFPQVIKTILPSITNEMITLVKDTSLAYSIAYMEMFTEAKLIAAARGGITALMVAGVFYYIFNLFVAFAMGRAERALSYYR